MFFNRKPTKSAQQIKKGDQIKFGGHLLVAVEDAHTERFTSHIELSTDNIPFTSSSDRVNVILPAYTDIEIVRTK